MGNVRLYGATSGYTELAPPAVAPDGVLSLPSGTGTLATQDYAAGAGGLVHINTTTVSSQSTVNFNNVFTSDYAVYQVYAVLTTAANDISLSLRLRLAGTDETGSNYRFQMINGQTSVGASASVTTSFNGMGLDNDNPNMRNITFIDPQNASVTGYSDLGYAGYATAQGARITGIHNVATAYDGFSLIAAGAFSGTVYVYGMRAAA